MTPLTSRRSSRRRSCPSRSRWLLAALCVVVLTLSLAACGGSGATTSAPKHETALAAAARATTPAPTKPARTTAAETRPMRATLAGENHAPKVNQPWSYTVTATDANGLPLSGTVAIEFALGGQVVGHDKPPTRPVTDGRLHETLKFPAIAVGVPLELQAVVHTTLGSLTLDWAIAVKS
jgi:hypothetical protein